MFSCKFGEIFKNTLFTEHLRASASAIWLKFITERLPKTFLIKWIEIVLTQYLLGVTVVIVLPRWV